MSQWLLLRPVVGCSTLSAPAPSPTIRCFGASPTALIPKYFPPSPAAEVRRDFGLPPDASLLLSIATKLGQHRKGLQYYPSLLKHLREHEPNKNFRSGVSWKSVAGGYASGTGALYPGLSVRPYQRSSRHWRKSIVLSIALSSCPPSTTSPTLCWKVFRVAHLPPGSRSADIPGYDRAGQTGILADLGDTDAMAAGIASLLDHPADLEHMRTECRRTAVEDFSLEVQAGRYLELYQEIITGACSCYGVMI